MVRKRGHGKAVDIYLVGVVLYELLTGLPPFYDDDKDILFNKILNQTLTFPPEVKLSIECKDILMKLLDKDPSRRISHFDGKGISGIRKHKFFREIDWMKVQKRELEQPRAYLSDMAMGIIQKQPYMLRDHPKTQGEKCVKGDDGYVEGWELIMNTGVNI